MNNITFVLATCGEETEKECIAAIYPIMDKIEFQVISHVYPQVKMLNQMLFQVNTEYFVELDSDMILNSNASERIQTAIDKYSHDPKWHTILFKLYDTFTEKDILSLKVMRSAIMKRFPFKDVPTPDVEHYGRLQNAGYYAIEDYLHTSTIGKHVLKGPHFCYHKYRDVYATLRYHQREWDTAVFNGGASIKHKSKNHFDFFLYKYITEDNGDYLSAIAGMVDGLTCDEPKSKSLSRTCLIPNEKSVDAYFEYYNAGYKVY